MKCFEKITASKGAEVGKAREDETEKIYGIRYKRRNRNSIQSSFVADHYFKTGGAWKTVTGS